MNAFTLVIYTGTLISFVILYEIASKASTKSTSFNDVDLSRTDAAYTCSMATLTDFQVGNVADSSPYSDVFQKDVSLSSINAVKKEAISFIEKANPCAKVMSAQKDTATLETSSSELGIMHMRPVPSPDLQVIFMCGYLYPSIPYLARYNVSFGTIDVKQVPALCDGLAYEVESGNCLVSFNYNVYHCEDTDNPFVEGLHRVMNDNNFKIYAGNGSHASDYDDFGMLIEIQVVTTGSPSSLTAKTVNILDLDDIKEASGETYLMADTVAVNDYSAVDSPGSDLRVAVKSCDDNARTCYLLLYSLRTKAVVRLITYGDYSVYMGHSVLFDSEGFVYDYMYHDLNEVIGREMYKIHPDSRQILATTYDRCLYGRNYGGDLSRVAFYGDKLICAVDNKNDPQRRKNLLFVNYDASQSSVQLQSETPLLYGYQGSKFGWYICGDEARSSLPSVGNPNCTLNGISLDFTLKNKLLLTRESYDEYFANVIKAKSVSCTDDYTLVADIVGELPPYMCSTDVTPTLLNALSQAFANSQIVLLALTMFFVLLTSMFSKYLAPAEAVEDDQINICGTSASSSTSCISFFAQLLRSQAHYPAEFFNVRKAQKAKASRFAMNTAAFFIFVVTAIAFSVLFSISSKVVTTVSGIYLSDISSKDPTFTCQMASYANKTSNISYSSNAFTSLTLTGIRASKKDCEKALQKNPCGHLSYSDGENANIQSLRFSGYPPLSTLSIDGQSINICGTRQINSESKLFTATYNVNNGTINFFYPEYSATCASMVTSHSGEVFGTDGYGSFMLGQPSAKTRLNTYGLRWFFTDQDSKVYFVSDGPYDDGIKVYFVEKYEVPNNIDGQLKTTQLLDVSHNDGGVVGTPMFAPFSDNSESFKCLSDTLTAFNYPSSSGASHLAIACFAENVDWPSDVWVTIFYFGTGLTSFTKVAHFDGVVKFQTGQTISQLKFDSTGQFIFVSSVIDLSQQEYNVIYKYDISTGSMLSSTYLPCYNTKVTFINDQLVLCPVYHPNSEYFDFRFVDFVEGAPPGSAEIRELIYGRGAKLGWHSCNGELLSSLNSMDGSCNRNSVLWSNSISESLLYTHEYMLNVLENSSLSSQTTCEADYSLICDTIGYLPPYVCSQDTFPQIIDSLSQGFANAQVIMTVLIIIAATIFSSSESETCADESDGDDSCCPTITKITDDAPGLKDTNLSVLEDNRHWFLQFVSAQTHLPVEFFHVKQMPKANSFVIALASAVVFSVTAASFVALYLYSSKSAVSTSTLSPEDLSLTDSSYDCSQLSSMGKTTLYACNQSLFPSTLSAITEAVANTQVVFAVVVMFFVLYFEILLPSSYKIMDDSCADVFSEAKVGAGSIVGDDQGIELRGIVGLTQNDEC